MTRTPSRLSLRTATASRTMNTFLLVGLGGALLALTAACSSDIDPGSDGFEEEVEEQGSNVVDAFEAEDALEPASDVIEKASFNDSAIFEGSAVNCTAAQKTLIRAAEARAREILGIAGPANASARVNRTTDKAGIFRTSFVPNGNTNPDPNRTSPDAWDNASFSVGQKLSKVAQVLASAFHTCHGPNEKVLRRDGVFITCSESGANASTFFEGGAENAVRWCDAGLNQGVAARAVTLLHELTHQDRTADARPGFIPNTNPPVPVSRVDDTSTVRLSNAFNYSRWYNNNQPQ